MSDVESYFSARTEPEYLTRLSMAVGKDSRSGAKEDAKSTRSGHSRAERSSTSTRASTTTTASTLSSLSFQSDSVVFNFPVPPSPGFAPSQQLPFQLGSLTHLPKSPKEQSDVQDWAHQRTSSAAAGALPIVSPKQRADAQDWIHHDASSDTSDAMPRVPKLARPPRRVRKEVAAEVQQEALTPPATRCRTASDASAALPHWMAADLPIRPDTAAGNTAEPDDDGESEFVKNFRARLCAPDRQRRAAFGGQQQTARQALEARDATAKPKKSKAKVTSPALANKLGVSIRSDIDLVTDDVRIRQDSDSVVESVITNVRGGSLWSYHF